MNAWLDQQRLIACVGSGGVGKTTTAAAIGLWAATRGRKVIVLTIDPAKRLANSLGLDQMGGEPTRIDLAALTDTGAPVAEGGELWAMMLDSRGTFDTLVAAVSPTPEARDRILGNHVYRAMADTLAGSQDYMATEKLYDLVQDGRWDLLVLDTPPVKNALDFLESPGKVVRFLDERILSKFLAPLQNKSSGSWASRLLGTASNALYRLLGAIFGSEFLDDFAQFLEDFNGLYEGFRKRHAAVLELLRAPTTTFVAVCAPNDASVEIATFFLDELRRRELPVSGVVVNQVHQVQFGGAAVDVAGHLTTLGRALAGDLPPGTDARLADAVHTAHRDLAERARLEAPLIQRVLDAAGPAFCQQVPRFLKDVYDLPALHGVGRALFRG